MPRLSRDDRFAVAVLILLTLFCYSWFFQGTGWNQNAQFDTIRALVEHHTAEITPYAQNTGDVGRMDGKIFSTKPPGFAGLGVPIYWIATLVERACGIDVETHRAMITNMQITTIALAAFPGAMIVLAIYVLFRRELSIRDSFILAGAMAFGSLVWLYSGVLMVQLAITAAMIWTWVLISDRARAPIAWRMIVTGALLGITNACDYSTAPLTALFIAYLVWRRVGWKNLALVCAGPLIALLAILAFNRWAFGHPFTTAYTIEDPAFKQPGLLFGQFDWPQWIRLYWISYHRMRGLFVCCPMFLVPLISLLAFRNWGSAFTVERIFPILVVLYFVMFELTFLGWTGGWGTGPRYLIGALPFLWLYARPGFVRYRAVSLILILLSVLNMLAVISVQVLQPANESGPPQVWDPISFAWLGFVRGQIALSPDSYNLGMLMGLRGMSSIAPVFAALIFMVVVATMLPSSGNENHLTVGSGSPSATDSRRTTSLS
jgi:hypothetical protein